MPVKKHSVEQIIAKLREIEKLTGQGMRPTAEDLRKAGAGPQRELFAQPPGPGR